MEYALYHSGYSPILRESKDGTAGLADAEGRVVIVGGGIQYHFMQYQLAVQAVLARYPAATLKPGESFITNDPYKAGSSHVARHGGDHAGVPRGPAHRLRRQRRAQGGYRRPRARLVGRRRARDFP